MSNEDYHHCPLYEVNWRVYVDLQVAGLRQEIESLRAAHSQDRAAAETAISKVDEATDKRLDDLRARVDVIASRQTPREVYETNHEELRHRVEALSQQVTAKVGETTGARATLAIGLSLAIIIITVITFVLDKTFGG